MWLLTLPQAATLPDTIIARTIPVRNVLDWTNGLLELLVLLLAVGALVAFIWLIRTIRMAIQSFNKTVDRLQEDVYPLISQASALVDEARDAVEILRDGALQIRDGASAISDELIYVADSTARRVDEINAVLDVLQDGLENTAISAVSTASGIHAGAAALATSFFSKRRRARSEPDLDDDEQAD